MNSQDFDSGSGTSLGRGGTNPSLWLSRFIQGGVGGGFFRASSRIEEPPSPCIPPWKRGDECVTENRLNFGDRFAWKFGTPWSLSQPSAVVPPKIRAFRATSSPAAEKSSPFAGGFGGFEVILRVGGGDGGFKHDFVEHFGRGNQDHRSRGKLLG